MASEWRTFKIDEIKAERGNAIAIGPFGSRMKADLYTETGVPVIRGNNLTQSKYLSGEFVFVTEETADQLRNCNVFADDLVFPHRGAIGEVGIVPKNGFARYLLSTSLMKLTCNQQIASPLYMYYFFRSPGGRYELLKRASTVGTPGIGQPLTSLRSIEVSLPPIGEQNRIAAILASLDDKIELNRKMNETLEALARALFKSWFVDFDPVRAKAEGRPTGLPDHIAALFPDSFEDSELGEIPKGWRVGTLGDFAMLNSETWTKNSRPATLRYVDLGNTKWGKIETIAEYDSANAPSRAQRVLRPGDTIVGTVRPGNGAYALITEGGLTGSTGFAVLRPKAPNCIEFVYLAATRRELIDELAHLADGGAYPAIRPEVVTSTSVVIPPEPLLNCFSMLAQALLAKVAHNDKQSETLATQRNLLLPKLVSGEIRLKQRACVPS